MQVLALVTDAFGGHGGIAQYNRDLLTALSMSGRTSSITALPRFAPETAATPSGITQLPSSASRVAWSARAVSCAVRSRPDVIFCGHLNAAPLAAALGKIISAQVWLQVHGIEAWTERSNLVRRAVESSSLVTSVSRFTRHRLLSWCNSSPDRVRVLPNTFLQQHRKAANRSDLAERHGLSGRKVILTVGRMAAAEAYKGHDRIIRCLPSLRQFVPEALYLVVGGGDDRQRLESLARQLNVSDKVIFAGVVPDAELPDYYALADVFAMPSTGEGFGIVFLEAADAGLPIISGNRDGSVDALADGTIGTAVDPDDCIALSAALQSALSGLMTPDPKAVQRFAFKNFARHVDDLVQSISNRGTGQLAER